MERITWYSLGVTLTLAKPTQRRDFSKILLHLGLNSWLRHHHKSPIMSLVSGEKSNFQFILRLLNTNVEGKQKVMYALTKIKGVGRRYSNLVCKKADVDLNKR